MYFFKSYQGVYLSGEHYRACAGEWCLMCADLHTKHFFSSARLSRGESIPEENILRVVFSLISPYNFRNLFSIVASCFVGFRERIDLIEILLLPHISIRYNAYIMPQIVSENFVYICISYRVTHYPCLDPRIYMPPFCGQDSANANDRFASLNSCTMYNIIYKKRV